MPTIMVQFEWLFRILLASGLGCFIGYERYSRSKEAGVRTHSIVCLAAAMMMIVSKYGFSDSAEFDAARVAAQIITGIGFLGAGIIFVKNDTVQGLTTAAGIWATSGIGMCIGAGLYLEGIFSAILIIVIQTVMHHTHYFGGSRTTMGLVITIEQNASTKSVVEFLEREGFTTSDVHIASSRDGKAPWMLNMEISTSRDMEPQKIVDSLLTISGVKSASVS
jgi:putative Mg2+ transporter-C (MgtC) family protein